MLYVVLQCEAGIHHGTDGSEVAHATTPLQTSTSGRKSGSKVLCCHTGYTVGVLLQYVTVADAAAGVCCATLAVKPGS